MWDVEEIPNAAVLYKRVHRDSVDENGQPKPVAFKNTPKKADGMSTNWAKYSTPQETKQGARTPEDNIVISLGVGEVREINGQTVIHSPTEAVGNIPANRAHTDVFGEKTPEARWKYMQIWKLVLGF